MVLITDPSLAMHVLYSQHFDKFRFAYSFLDPVSLYSSSHISKVSMLSYFQARKLKVPQRQLRIAMLAGLQLLNGSSILTGPTDEHWKQVRKGVAPAFSTQHMK